ISWNTARRGTSSPTPATRAPKATSAEESAKSMSMNNERHIATVFDRDLEAIQAMIMKMGGLVEAAISQSALALETRDEELSEQVRRADKAIDALEDLINTESARLIALRSPTASDLRTVLTVMKIA